VGVQGDSKVDECIFHLRSPLPPSPSPSLPLTLPFLRLPLLPLPIPSLPSPPLPSAPLPSPRLIHNTTWFFFGGIWLLIAALCKTVYGAASDVERSKGIDRTTTFIAVATDVSLLLMTFIVQHQYSAKTKALKHKKYRWVIL
jgi:hypothetical protein